MPDKELVPIDKLLFRRPSDNAFTAFGENSNGEIEFAFNPLFAKIGAYHKIAWYESIWVQLGILAFCSLVFFSRRETRNYELEALIAIRIEI